LRQKLPLLKEALQGRFRPHHRFLLEEILQHLDYLDGAIERLSQEVLKRIVPFSALIKLMDLIPGIDQRVAEGILSEIGANMNWFPSERHLSSWAGACPGNNESAGKRKSGKTRKGNRWLYRYLIEAAWAASRSKGTYFNALYHRLTARRGKKKAIVAVAHSLLVVVYHILKNQVPYHELGADHFDKINLNQIKRHHLKRLENLGFRVTLEPLHQAA
jgi:transposase